MKRASVRSVGALVLLGVLVIGTIGLWPASEEAIQVDALASSSLDEVRRAAEMLAASGATGALEPLHEARGRLVDLLVDSGNRDLKQFGHHFDSRRVADRRQSTEARRLWQALGAVTGAIAVLDPQAAEKRRAQREEWDGEWELPTEEVWAESTEDVLELPTEEERNVVVETEEIPVVDMDEESGAGPGETCPRCGKEFEQTIGVPWVDSTNRVMLLCGDECAVQYALEQLETKRVQRELDQGRRE